MRSRLIASVALAAGLALCTPAVAAPAPEVRNHSLYVDGAPYLILGAQINNSSSWPAAMPEVWPAVKEMGANTVLAPVAWQQIEPKEGQFDWTIPDMLVDQARAHGVRLALLWFGTWKNNGPAYTPGWVKLDNARFPRVVTDKGEVRDSLSPFAPATLAADAHAFAALMRHLRQIDGERHTVIMVQVENETGVYGAVRDFSPLAQAVFAQAVPAGVPGVGRPGSGWRDAFGRDADERFEAWGVARFVDQVAAAGKAEYRLPMYANTALRSFEPQAAEGFSSGGPTWDVLDIWRAMAPHLDLLAPDIYNPDPAYYDKVLDAYARPDNPLYVAETGNAAPYARFLFSVLGHGAIGFSPFGIDYTGYVNYPLGAPVMDADAIKPFALAYASVSPAMREWARWNVEGRLVGTAEAGAPHQQTLPLGDGWVAEVGYGQLQFGMDPPVGNPQPSGGVLIARLGPGEYVLTGLHARVSFKRLDGRRSTLVSAEEVGFDGRQWVRQRIWNGDQTDYGLNLGSSPTTLRVSLATF